MALDNPRYATLVADTVNTVTFTRDYERVEVSSVDGTTRVDFTVDGSTPVRGQTGTHYLPAAISAVELDVSTAGPTVVKLLATAACVVSVRGMQGIPG